MQDSDIKKLRSFPVYLSETNDGIIIKRGAIETRIKGRGALQVIRTILAATSNGGATLEEIHGRFGAENREDLEDLIGQLVAKRILTSTTSAEPLVEGPESNMDIFYWHFGNAASSITKRLNSYRLTVLGVNCISVQLARALEASHWENFQVVDVPLLRNLRLFDDSGTILPAYWPNGVNEPIEFEYWVKNIDLSGFGCLVATSDFGGQQAMRNWNQFCVQHNRHFLPIVLQNLIGYIGPLVIPGETACFECLYSRQNSHIEDPAVQRAGEQRAFEAQLVSGFHPSMATILGNLAVFELMKFYSGAIPGRNVGTLIEVSLLATQLVTRKVLKIPRCAVCSSMNTRSSINTIRSVFAPLIRTPK